MITDEKSNKLGDEAPTLKHFMIVLFAAALLTVLSWIMWFKLGWFH